MRKYFFFLSIFLIFYACSNSRVIKHDSKGTKNVNLSVNEVYAWVNYMPGENAVPLFRISGDLTVKKSSEYDLKSISLSKIVVYQDTMVVYNIKPVIKENEKESNLNKRNMLFNLLKGLELNESLDIDKKIDVEFVFEYENKYFTYFINNIGIEKTY